MARMSSDDKREGKDYGDSSQLTNCILDSGDTCDMMPEVTYFIPESLEDTDKFIEVADRHHVTAKQKVSVRIQICDDNRTHLWHECLVMTNAKVKTTVTVCN